MSWSLSPSADTVPMYDKTSSERQQRGLNASEFGRTNRHLCGPERPEIGGLGTLLMLFSWPELSVQDNLTFQ